MNILNNDLLGNYVEITPMKAIFTDILDSNVLVASLEDDNLTNGCVFRFKLYNLTSSTTSPTDGSEPITSYVAVMMFTDTVQCAGVDYTNWDGDNIFVYNYIAGKKPITIL